MIGSTSGITRVPNSDNFVNVEFDAKNLDRYWIRFSIRAALLDNMPCFKGNLLDVGCGRMPYREFILEQTTVVEYIGLDKQDALDYGTNTVPDETWDGITMPFSNGSFDTVIATEVLEHCPEPNIILREINRVLSKNGLLFFTVPFLWNLHEVPHDEYRYTPFALERHLRQTGFQNIEIRATGGWHASMAQMLGLWVRRAPMSARKRRYLSVLLKPAIAYLIKKDSVPRAFREGTMVSGLSGTARK